MRARIQMSRRTKRCIYVQRRAALFFGRDTRAGSTFRPLRELVPAAAERPPRPGEGEVVCHWCVTRCNRVRSNCFSLFFLFAFRFIEELSLLLDSGRYCFFFLSPTSFHSRWIQENLPFFVARFFYVAVASRIVGVVATSRHFRDIDIMKRSVGL